MYAFVALDGTPCPEFHWHESGGSESDLLMRVDQSTGQASGVMSWGALGTSSVGIHEDEIPMADGEYIIDAYGEYSRWKLFDVLKSLITFGIYYMVYLRREMQKQKAIIVTNYRLIQVKKAGFLRNRLPVYGSTIYDLDLKWWSLENAYAGFVHEQGITSWGEVATKHGVVKVTLDQFIKYPEHSQAGSPRSPSSTLLGAPAAIPPKQGAPAPLLYGSPGSTITLLLWSPSSTSPKQDQPHPPKQQEPQLYPPKPGAPAPPPPKQEPQLHPSQAGTPAHPPKQGAPAPPSQAGAPAPPPSQAGAPAPPPPKQEPQPTHSSRSPWSRAGLPGRPPGSEARGGEVQVQSRFRNVLFAMASVVCEPVIENPAEYGLHLDDVRCPNLPASMLPLPSRPKEQVLGQFCNENLYEMWLCGNWTECCTCGFRPINLHGNITVSTHRFVVTVNPNYKPYCCGGWFITEEFMWVWGRWDHSKSLQGFSLQGTMKDHTLFCDSCCNLCFPGRRWRAKFSMVDFNMMSFNRRAVQLRMKYLADPQGYLEEPRVQHMRNVMEAILGAPGMQRAKDAVLSLR
ncbi:hypothetical protein CYMTET_18673 [Cymbomonas tetramitiformis]|uniref:Uncharacterized protein n=1 Tax=Cymbomonas tetramitiformis TaxID=36881 RepID=A0AAE0G7J4_9CHLO|nr:hypothetical protein CYMTET_18673 [Cymbomonas tetramitiformis]